MRFLCRFPWRFCHDLMFPIRGIERCQHCARPFISAIFGADDPKTLELYKLDLGE